MVFQGVVCNNTTKLVANSYIPFP